MHVGLIGGIGPAATSVYYEALSRRCAEAGKRLKLTIANADVRELTANMQAGRQDVQARIFAGHIDQLKAGGCEAVAITSMGGHACLDILKPISALPIINAATAHDRCFAERGFKRVGVMGTQAVMSSRLYGVSSAEVIAPAEDDFAVVHDHYLAIAIAAAATPEQCAFFCEEGRKLVERGAEVVILGGTDLSVAFRENPGYPILDSALVHAEAIAQVAMDNEPVSAFS